MTDDGARPDPDALLARVQAEAEPPRARLKIFFGAAPGVGKTFAMLESARRLLWLQANLGFEEGVAAAGEDGMWMGFGVQPVYHVDDKLSLCGRIEAFLDGDGARTGTEQTLLNVSVTPSYKLHDHLTVRAEGRLDFSTEDLFQSDDPTSEPGAMQVVALAEASVAF